MTQTELKYSSRNSAFACSDYENAPPAPLTLAFLHPLIISANISLELLGDCNRELATIAQQFTTAHLFGGIFPLTFKIN